MKFCVFIFFISFTSCRILKTSCLYTFPNLFRDDSQVKSIVYKLSLIKDVKHNVDRINNLDVIKFHINQYQNLLVNLLTPCIKDKILVKTEKKEPSNESNSKEAPFDWEYKISTEKEPITCSIISNVSPGTVMMRPRGTDYDYVALTALANLYHQRPGILKTLYPNNDIKNLNEVYKYASSYTLLMRLLVVNMYIRMLILLSVLYGGLQLSYDFILDIMSAIIRSNILWDPRVYNVWSRIYHSPMPMFILTLRKILYTLMDGLLALDDEFKELLLDLECTMLNHDIKTRKNIEYVIDNNGRILKHNKIF